MSNSFVRIAATTFFSLVLLESLSLLGHEFPLFGAGLLIAMFLIILAVAFWKLEVALLAVFAELIVGGKGYLLSLEVGGVEISLRLALFSAIMLSYLVGVLSRKYAIDFSSRYVRGVLVGIAVILLGTIIALARGNSYANIFFDGNGYLFLLLGFPIFSAITDRKRASDVLAVMTGGALLLAIKTIVILSYFGHVSSADALRTVYSWIRDTGVGEITNLGGGFYRVFFQSHIFNLLALVAVLLPLVMREISSRREMIRTILLAQAMSVATIISFSRSFWLSLSVLTLAIFIYAFVQRGLKRLLLPAGMIVISFIAQLLVITFFAKFPLPGKPATSISPATLLRERVTDTEEAALSSRANLLKPLTEKILEHPVLGSGLGATVTYQTKDPRAIAATGGKYTTYAFEWGYLDFAVKFGLVGAALIIWVLWMFTRQLWLAVKAGQRYATSILAVFLALVVTHATTPYLNHPLGIGALLVLMVCARVFLTDAQVSPKNVVLKSEQVSPQV